MYDDEFIIDKIQIQKDTNWKLKMDDVKYMSYKFSSISAFSTCWPYLVFSGLRNYIMIINSFNQKHIYRIQIAETDEKCKICQTFITDTMDLFVMTKKNGLYQLFELDLDKLNYLKYGNDENDKHFKFEQILEYYEEFVNSKELNDLHIRGSSKKEYI